MYQTQPLFAHRDHSFIHKINDTSLGTSGRKINKVYCLIYELEKEIMDRGTFILLEAQTEFLIIINRISNKEKIECICLVPKLPHYLQNPEVLTGLKVL